MKIACPVCKKDNQVKYLGVYHNGDFNCKIYKCSSTTHIHFTTIHFVDRKDDERTRDMLDEEDVKDALKDRIRCPLCTKYKKESDGIKLRFNTQDYQYKYVLSKGNSDRFYCKNHKDKKHNRYEFKKISIKDNISLRKLFTTISLPLYKRLRDIYRSEEEYDFKNDPDNLLKFLFCINISHDIIATIFHSTQPTIYRLNRKKKYPLITKVVTVRRDHRLYYTKVRLKRVDLEKLIESISYKDKEIHFLS